MLPAYPVAMEKIEVPFISEPWAERRPILSLWFTSLLLVFCTIAHAESGREMVNRIIHSCAAYILSLLGALGLTSFLTVAPVTLTSKAAAVPVHHQLHKSHLITPPAPLLPLMNDPTVHEFTYIFEGKGTYLGQPCSRASVLVRLSTPRTEVYQGAVTDADGNYSVSLKINASDNEPVDFSVEAYNPDFQKIELVGRRIVMHEDSTVTVQKPLDFIPG